MKINQNYLWFIWHMFLFQGCDEVITSPPSGEGRGGRRLRLVGFFYTSYKGICGAKGFWAVLFWNRRIDFYQWSWSEIGYGLHVQADLGLGMIQESSFFYFSVWRISIGTGIEFWGRSQIGQATYNGGKGVRGQLRFQTVMFVWCCYSRPVKSGFFDFGFFESIRK